MRFKCLILDHDDTVVDSTKTIHYPAFLEALRQMRPDHFVTLQEYFELNFDPGFLAYCEHVLGFTSQELDREYGIWQSFVEKRVPTAYPGIREIIERQKALGGYVCVISHSVRDKILRDYEKNHLPEPDLIYGWELPREQRKPSVFAIEDIMARLHVQRADILVVDDLKPGYDMARDAGVRFAAAQWAYHVPGILGFMRDKADYCFISVDDLATFLRREDN